MVSDVREDLLQQERGVGIAEGVVLRIPILGLAGVDEDTDRHGHLASVNQVVEDDGSTHSPSGSRYMWPSWKTMSDAGSEAVYSAGTYTQ